MFLQEKIVEFRKSSLLTGIVEKLRKGRYPLFFCSKNYGFFSFLVSSLCCDLKDKIFLVICQDPETAEIFYSNIKTFLDKSVILFPEKDVHLPPDHPVQAKEIERVMCLADLIKKNCSAVVTSIQAISVLLPDISNFVQHIIEIRPGLEIKREKLISRLIAYGYEEVEVVENPGEFCRRGGIIDFFQFKGQAIRIVFVGDTVESIRTFDPQTQMSTGKIENCKLISLNESFISAQNRSSIFDYAGENRIIFLVGAASFEDKHRQLKQLCHRSIKKDIIEMDILKTQISRSISLELEIPPDAEIDRIVVFPVDTPSRFGFIGEQFIWNPVKNEQIFIVEENKVHRENLKKILKDHNVEVDDNHFIDGYLSDPFTFPVINLTLINTATIFNAKPGRPFRRFMESLPVTERNQLSDGDYVVHYQYGIAKFDGFEKIGPGDEEFLKLEFAEGEKLYLPLSDIEFIHKYVGTKENPQLSKLGSKTWIKIRNGVKEGIQNIARELYNLYVERKHGRGFAYPEDDEFQRMIEEKFPYQETVDQLRAIEEIKKDLQSTKIMDRLLCGDSGYGKTELAIRAAFKVVSGGKQVALLCPTTVLAQQHLRTFKQRMHGFPVNIEMLSRLYSTSRQRKILEQIATGKIDIIIGTHRILQEDVLFKNLGLIIIDEEQRFGVLHKEKLKTKFRNIEVLTLTATPIPRTLYLSLSGLRDISLLETPPEGRLSVATYVGRYSDTIVKMAILNELERQGQIFYLHNRIYDIHTVKNKLQQMFPATNIAIAHGRMSEQNLASVMDDFADGKIQILVATTIVENGLDVPNANTLIVDNAHLFGLADLYQLRGRVGRYKVKAYAYFLIPGHLPVSEQTKERLKAISELVKPGSGMKIAMRDLQIRGAGDILGKKQSGYINQVGFELYCRFWKEVSSKYTGEKVQEPQTRPMLRGFIDPEWIPAPGLRFELYKRISEIQDFQHAKIILEELEDRFGHVPEKVKKMILSISTV
ncbi:MAG: transcription-repair coupling factor [Candidatus Omnitrophica bacterium]|nr:transcription-repair coupling factor [Candidatus Omnitrophota bacterium]MCM8824631.1 transcription-repair coupling factor [Candidatus Omnitrophota bacterium]